MAGFVFWKKKKKNKVNPNSKAANQGLGSGDHIDSINGERTDGLMHNEALQLIRKANNTLHLQLTKAETKPKLVIPEIRINGPPVTGQLNAQNLSYFDSLSKLTNHEPGIYPTGPTGGGASYQSDGEMSGSTSDSQSSIIQVVEGRKQPLTKPETPPAAMDVSTSGDSGTAPVWSPFGSKSAKGYKPVSFNVSGSPTKSVTQPASGLSFPPSKVSSSPPSHNTVGQSYSSVSVSPHPHPTHPAHPVHSQSSSSSSSASSSVYASSSSKSPLTSSVTPHTTGSSPHPFSPAAVSTKPGLAPFLCKQPTYTPLPPAESPVCSAPSRTRSSLASPTLLKQTRSTPARSVSDTKRLEPPKPGIKTNALTPMEPQPRKTTTHPSPKAPTPSSSFPTKSRGMSAFLARQYADPEDETEPQTRGEVKPQPVEQARPSTPKPAMLSSSMPTFKPSPPKKFGPAPTAKSRGMALFLNMKEKHATLDEEEEEGTPKITDNGVDATGEGAPVGVSAGISPVVGRAVPIPIKNDVAVAADTKPRGDLHKLSGLGMTNGQASTTVNATVASVTDSALNKVSSQHDKPEGGFVPSAQLSSLSLLDKALEERKREREAARRGGPPPYTAPQSQTFSPAMDGRSMSAGTCTTTTSTATSLPTTTDTHSSWNGSISHFAETKSGLPQPQSATITLLQRNRERRQAQERELHEDETDNNQHVQSLLDKIEQAKLTNDRPLSCGMNGDSHLSSVDGETETSVPDNAIMVGKRETVEGDKKHYDTFYLLPDEKTVTQTETREIKAPPKLHGIGPKDAKTGIPLTLRKSVDDDSQKDWYRSMYKSLHKMEPGAKDTNPYQPTYAFPEEKSEPKREEPNPYMPSYEYPSSRFHDKENGTMTLDRYTSSSSNRDKSKNWSPPHARYRTEKYKNQPHRIEDYEPGRSSLALRESRLDDDEQSQRHNPALDKPGDHNKYVDCKTEVEFHKRDRASSPALSDITAHRAYRTVQKGGDIPTSGFGFPQPQKKDYDDDLNYYTDSEAVINPSHNYKSTRKVTLLTRGGGQTSDRGGRGQYERSLSALGRIGDMSPSGYTERERERSYATTPTPSSSGIRYSISDAHNAAERKRREEEAARQRSLDMERLHAQQKQKAQPRKHSSSYSNGVELDRAFCDDKYWLKLAGLDDDGRPVQKSPISLTRFDDRDASSLERPVMKKQTMIRGKARAKYNFKAQNSKELSFHKGDTVYLLRQVDKNWCEGEHHGLIGIFPINYVEVLMSLDEARTAAILREGQAQAKYNFNPQTRKELALKKGEKVTLIRRVDENWYEGRTADEKQGIFPANYVEVMREPDTPMVTPASSFAPTPRTVSPGPMSPVGSIAPTIPSAPMSPRSAFNDDFDLDNFNFEVNATQLTSPSSRSQSRQEYGGGSSSLPNYHSDYSNTALSSSAPQRSMGAYGTMDTKRSTSSLGMGPTRDHYSTERPSSAVPFGMQKSTVITSASLSPSYQLASSSGGRRGAASSVGRGASQSPFGFTDSSLDTRSQEARPVVTPVRDRPLSPYMERTLGVKSPSPSYGKPKEEISKPFEGPSYPAYRSMYNYRPQNKDELELKEGDVVYVIEKCDDGWFVGTSQRTKEIGTFPGNYVHKL